MMFILWNAAIIEELENVWRNKKYMRKYLKELFRKEYKIKLIIRLENDEFFFHFISNISTLLTNEM